MTVTGSKAAPKSSNAALDGLEFDEREASKFVVGLEDVAEHVAQKFAVARRGIERQLTGPVAIGERAQVVDAENVVGVGVRVEDGVELSDVFAQGLFAKVGRGVDENVAVVVGEQDGGTGAAIAGIGGMTDGAVAGDGGNAHRGAAAEDREGGAHRRNGL